MVFSLDIRTLLGQLDVDTWLKAIAMLGAVLSWLYARRQKPRLQWFFTYFGAHNLPGTAAGINTHGIVVQNVGYATATNVRVTHAYVPPNTDIQIWPRMAYTVTPMQPGGSEILIDRLRPKEHVAVSYLYPSAHTGDQFQTRVRYDDGPGTNFPIQYTRLFPQWFLRMLATWMVIGFAVTLYFVLKLVVLLIFA